MLTRTPPAQPASPRPALRLGAGGSAAARRPRFCLPSSFQRVREGIKAAAPSCSSQGGAKPGLGTLRGGGSQPHPLSATRSALLQLTLQSTKSRVAFFEEL